MLKVPQQDDFAIRLVHLVDRCLKSDLQFLPGCRGGGREFGVGQFGGQVHRGMVEHRRSHHRLFAIHAAPRRPAMPPMGVDQPVAGHLPQPQMKRHRRIRKIFFQSAVGIEQHILHNITGVDPAADHAIHAQVDHPP